MEVLSTTSVEAALRTRKSALVVVPGEVLSRIGSGEISRLTGGEAAWVGWGRLINKAQAAKTKSSILFKYLVIF
jgi:hypothetical protein